MDLSPLDAGVIFGTHLRIDIWGDDLFVLDFETTLAIGAILIILTGTTPNSYNHFYSISQEAKV